MIHAGDIVKVKGSHPAHGLMRVVSVSGDVATLRYLDGSLEFGEYIYNLDWIACHH